MVELNTKNGRISVWNGGCPPAVLLNSDGAELCKFHSNHLPLGILNPGYFSDEVTHFHYGKNHCQLLLCSDGALDSTDPGSMELGLSHLLQIAGSEKPGERLSAMVRMLEQKLQGKLAHDDIALILVDCPVEDRSQLKVSEKPESIYPETTPATPQDVSQDEVQVEWEMALSLTAPQLRQTDIVPLLLHIVNQIEIEDPDLSGKLFLILSELFNNALDHGLLKLDSSLKNDPEGMDRYYEVRSLRVKELGQGEIKINLQKVLTPHGPGLNIVLSDTGAGFDYQELKAAALEPSMRRHGRGIALVESLSSQFYYADSGRESHVSLLLQSASQTI